MMNNDVREKVREDAKRIKKEIDELTEQSKILRQKVQETEACIGEDKLQEDNINHFTTYNVLSTYPQDVQLKINELNELNEKIQLISIEWKKTDDDNLSSKLLNQKDELRKRRDIIEESLKGVKLWALEKPIIYKVSPDYPQEVQLKVKELNELIQLNFDLRKKISYLDGCLYPYSRLCKIEDFEKRKEHPLSVDEISYDEHPWKFGYDDDELKVATDLFNKYPIICNRYSVVNDENIPHIVIACTIDDPEHTEGDKYAIFDAQTGEEIFPFTAIPSIDGQSEVSILKDGYEFLFRPRTAKAIGVTPNPLLEQQYDKVLYGAYAVVIKNGKYGLCTKDTGEVVIKCEYDLVSLFKIAEEKYDELRDELRYRNKSDESGSRHS